MSKITPDMIAELNRVIKGLGSNIVIEKEPGRGEEIFCAKLVDRFAADENVKTNDNLKLVVKVFFKAKRIPLYFYYDSKTLRFRYKTLLERVSFND